MVLEGLGCGRIGFGELGASGAIVAITTNMVFVTSTAQPPGALGGLAGADAVCNDRATAAGLPGTYVAWLSTATVNARDRLGSARGWSRPDGRPFADTADDVAAANIRYPARIDELGDDLGSLPAAERVVATGTYGGTASIGSTCADYDSPSGNVIAGYLDATRGGWTSGASGTGANDACSTAMRLYCFGVDRSVALPPLPPISGGVRIAFATASGWPPGGGLAGADAHCQTEADAAGLGGQFRALLATSTTSAASRFDLSGPNWVKVDGTPLADSPTALMHGESLTSLDLNAAGGQPGYSGVWTGAAGDGTSAPDTVPATDRSCTDWTDYLGTTGGGMGYDFESGAGFFDQAVLGCTTGAAVLYCFEQ